MAEANSSEKPRFPEISESLHLFGVVAMGWLVFSGVYIAATSSEELPKALIWLGVIGGLTWMDLLATGKLLAGVMALSSGDLKNRELASIRAFAWGSVKLACLGLIGAILYFGRAVPTASLLLGLATLIVVPVVGGLWWHQRVLRHA